MTLWIILLGILAPVYVVGFQRTWIATARRMVEDDIRKYRVIADDPGRQERWKRDALFNAWWVALIWPAYVPIQRAIARALDSLGPTSLELQQRVKELKEAERDLERRSKEAERDLERRIREAESQQKLEEWDRRDDFPEKPATAKFHPEHMKRRL